MQVKCTKEKVSVSIRVRKQYRILDPDERKAKIQVHFPSGSKLPHEKGLFVSTKEQKPDSFFLPINNMKHKSFSAGVDVLKLQIPKAASLFLTEYPLG